MPKIIDHTNRRQEIVSAVWRVIERDGLQKLSLGDVAREAGFTTGVLPTYFRNKKDLLEAAFAAAVETYLHRVNIRTENSPNNVDRLFVAMDEILPRKEAPDTVAMVVMCFAVREEENGSLSDVLQEKNQRCLQYLSDCIIGAVDAGEISSEINPVEAVKVIVFALDGLCYNAMALPNKWSTSARRSAIHAIIETILKIRL